jgi:hypothetical protein
VSKFLYLSLIILGACGLYSVKKRKNKNKTTHDCYSPKHAFVFYDSNDFPFAYIELDFTCNEFRISPDQDDKLEISEKDMKKLKSMMFDELNLSK